MQKIKITRVETHYQDSYVLLNRAEYSSKSGQTKHWAYIERRNGMKAVVVIPVNPLTEEVVLIRQFRVPVQKEVIEFPAGLMEPGEDPGDCGLRELKEETGYSGTLLSVSPPLATSAGLGTEVIYLVLAEICGDPGPQELEDSEEIEVLKIPLVQAESILRTLSSECLIDSKVWALLGWLPFFQKSLSPRSNSKI